MERSSQLIVGGTDRLGMNSKAHRENPLKRVKDVLFLNLQPFMGLGYEPRNLFRGGTATEQRAFRISGHVFAKQSLSNP
jgi:hypothetical protein